MNWTKNQKKLLQAKNGHIKNYLRGPEVVPGFLNLDRWHRNLVQIVIKTILLVNSTEDSVMHERPRRPLGDQEQLGRA